MLKQMWVFGFVWVACTVPYDSTPPHPTTSCPLFHCSTPPSSKMLKWKETIRPQISADTEAWRRSPLPSFLFFYPQVQYVLCTVTPPLPPSLPMSKITRCLLLCPNNTCCSLTTGSVQSWFPLLVFAFLF